VYACASQAIHGHCPRPAADVSGFVRSLGYVGSYIKEFEADSALLEQLAEGTLRNASLLSIITVYSSLIHCTIVYVYELSFNVLCNSYCTSCLDL
jgi:hypothetical protein